MSSKIKDLVDVQTVDSTPDEMATPKGRLESFLMTYEHGDAIKSIVRTLFSTDDGPRNCIVVGSSGSGKSSLLRVTTSLFQIPADVGLPPLLRELRDTVGPTPTLVVALGKPQGDVSLSEALVEEATQVFQEAGVSVPEATNDHSDIQRFAVGAMLDAQRLLVAIDDLDDWLRRAGKFAFANHHTLELLGQLSRELPIATCLVAGSGVLFDDASGTGGQKWMSGLHLDYKIQYVPGHVLRTATASRVLRKNARQRQDIRQVFRDLREKLPQLGYDEDEFIDLYPLEVSTWTIGSHLHRWIDGFSFPEFASRAASSVRGRPAISLFALNDMLERYEPLLRRLDALEPIFSSYDQLLTDAVPKLASSQRLWARIALQSIFMHTIAGLPADAVTITNSILVYNLRSSESSYRTMATILSQLESLGSGRIVGQGEGEQRRYSLVSGRRDALTARVEELAAEIVDESEIMWALLKFGSKFFADWPLGDPLRQSTETEFWDVEQDDGAVHLQTRAIDESEVTATLDIPELIILGPGSTWSEAHERANNRARVACWIASAPTPAGIDAIKRWIAVSRLASSEGQELFVDLSMLRDEIEAEVTDVFRRIYIDRGTIVTVAGSDSITEFVDPSRNDNLLVRLLPESARASLDIGEIPSPAVKPTDEHIRAVRWLANLTAGDRNEAHTLESHFEEPEWLERLGAWFKTATERNLSSTVKLLSERFADSDRVSSVLDAKRRLDKILYYTRRAVGQRSLEGLGDRIESTFEDLDHLWEDREKLEWLHRLDEWWQQLSAWRSYLEGAALLEAPNLEANRMFLRDRADDLMNYLDDVAQEEFARDLEVFLAEYTELYRQQHESSVGASVIDYLATALVESESWRALETFTALPFGDDSFLMAASKALSRLRNVQCTADTGAILRRQPRCVCGYQFGDKEFVAAYANDIREAVQQGLEHHRIELRDRRAEFREKLKVRKDLYDRETVQALAELTSDGELPAITDRLAEALHDLLSDSDPVV